MSSTKSTGRKTLNIEQLQLCFRGMHHLTYGCLEELRARRCVYFKRNNQRTKILNLMEEVRSMASKTYLHIHDLDFQYKEMIKNARRIFGSEFIHSLNYRVFDRKSTNVKQIKSTLKNLTNMTFPQLHDIPVKRVSAARGPIGLHSVAGQLLPNSTESYPALFGTITAPIRQDSVSAVRGPIGLHSVAGQLLPNSAESYPALFGTITAPIRQNRVMPIVIAMSEDKWKTDKCNKKTMSKILTIASEDDGKVFEFIRSKIAEQLRMDIVWINREYIIWYKLKNLLKKIEQSSKYVLQYKTRYFMLNNELDQILMPTDSPSHHDITAVVKKYDKLEQGLKILDNYSKINEFAKWASEYGNANQSDPDIVDAVEWVNVEADTQLNLLHNELICVRNYCNIQNMSLFE